MKRRALLLVAGLVVAAVAGLGWWAAGREAAPATTSEAPAPALAVRPVWPARESWPQALPAAGSIAAWEEVVIAPEIGGLRLAQLHVSVGDRVRKGQLLARLSPGTLEADVAASRAALHEAEAAAAEARRAAGRALSLQGTEVLSAQAIDQAVAAAQAAEARLAAARARAQGDALRLAYTRVQAPDDGVISARPAVEGALVQAGEELMRLQRHGRLEWCAELPGPDLAQVEPGQAARVLVGAQAVSGRVRQVAPQVDLQRRTGIVHVELDPAPGLRAGLFARGEILGAPRPVLTLPDTALLLRDGQAYVFRIEGDTVRQQKVTPGARRGDRVEIRAGLAPDAAVVESGVGFLADGMTVRVVDAPPSSKERP